MCGICGYIGKERIELSEIKRMNYFMCHRGPDDSGEIIFDDRNYCLGMGHQRLSIVDLSKNGHQPMVSADNRIVLVFNGEIYNYKELKKQLYYPFISYSDTEVVIAAYLKWGIDCVTYFNGMFAFALYDKKIGKLFLARDRFGKKPLYVYQDGGTFIYASSVYSIVTNRRFHLEIDDIALKNYLVRSYSLSPKTVLKNVSKVCPGEIWEIQQGTVHQWKYWDLFKHYDSIKQSFMGGYNQAKIDLRKALEDAVSYRLHADVPVGVLLSGGIDSSLVAAIASKVSNIPIRTFTIGFEDEKFNEAIYAKEIANRLGTCHKEQYISERDLISLLDKIQEAYDEPFADSSQIATMYVAKLAADDGIKVLLSGDGGDEFYCGYQTYRDLKIAQKIDWVGKFLYMLGSGSKSITGKLPFAISAIINNRNPKYKTQFNMGRYIMAAEKMIPEGQVLYDESNIHVNDWVTKRMLLDINTYLADDILHKVDRATMFYSVEARNPLLDYNLAILSLSMSPKFKYSKGITKRILRDLLFEIIPKNLFERPKSGFEVPISKWMRGILKDELKDYSCASFLRKQGIFNAKTTEHLVHMWLKNDMVTKRGENIQEIIWAFYNFQKWYLHYSKLQTNNI